MSDRLLSSLARIVATFAPVLRFARWEYRVQVVSATPPITVDAIPAGASPFGPISGIKLWPGTDGSVAVPAVGSLVELTFAEGDPGKPRIVGLDPDQEPTMVYVGNQASGEFTALASRVAQLQTAYNLHTHGGVTAGVAASGVPVVTQAISFGSTTVQVTP